MIEFFSHSLADDKTEFFFIKTNNTMKDPKEKRHPGKDDQIDDDNIS